jgi:hypothetical protein
MDRYCSDFVNLVEAKEAAAKNPLKSPTIAQFLHFTNFPSVLLFKAKIRNVHK